MTIELEGLKNRNEGSDSYYIIRAFGEFLAARMISSS